jgi:hypothetical protein
MSTELVLDVGWLAITGVAELLPAEVDWVLVADCVN